MISQTTNTKKQIFISPFIRTIAIEENISMDDLYNIEGSGLNKQLTKEDIIHFLEGKSQNMQIKIPTELKSEVIDNELEERIPLNRMRKLIAGKMVRSKQISPHVSSFVEVNISKLVEWRIKIKNDFLLKYGQNITLTPFFVQAVASGLKKFPVINAILDEDHLLIKKQINIGIATALPDGNLIVPVIHAADTFNLPGLALSIHDLADRARKGALKPNDIQGGTFTVSNVGSFGNIGGTPIINQPELAILAVGAVVKKPVAVLTENGYGIAVQDVVELWLSYDHRVIDGSLGGQFLNFIGDYLTKFDVSSVF